MAAVPQAQLETAAAYGMTPCQTFRRILVPVWVYALPGLSNLWMILVKATPLLFLFGRYRLLGPELGGTKGSTSSIPIRLADLVLYGAVVLPGPDLRFRTRAGAAAASPVPWSGHSHEPQRRVVAWCGTPHGLRPRSIGIGERLCRVLISLASRWC